MSDTVGATYAEVVAARDEIAQHVHDLGGTVAVAGVSKDDEGHFVIIRITAGWCDQFNQPFMVGKVRSKVGMIGKIRGL